LFNGIELSDRHPTVPPSTTISRENNLTRKDIRHIAVRLNNPILLLALERHDYHGMRWEQAMNEAIIELAKQNEYFLDQLISSKTGVKPTPMPVRTAPSSTEAVTSLQAPDHASEADSRQISSGHRFERFAS